MQRSGGYVCSQEVCLTVVLEEIHVEVTGNDYIGVIRLKNSHLIEKSDGIGFCGSSMNDCKKKDAVIEENFKEDVFRGMIVMGIRMSENLMIESTADMHCNSTFVFVFPV